MNNKTIIMKKPVLVVIRLAKKVKATTPENIAIGIYQIKALLKTLAEATTSIRVLLGSPAGYRLTCIKTLCLYVQTLTTLCCQNQHGVDPRPGRAAGGGRGALSCRKNEVRIS